MQDTMFLLSNYTTLCNLVSTYDKHCDGQTICIMNIVLHEYLFAYFMLQEIFIPYVWPRGSA